MKYLKLLRVKHYLKNLLILLPMFFGKRLFDIEIWGQVAGGFFSFCAISSTVYIINDIKDLERDKLHPKKCKRPLATGEISRLCALVIGGSLFVLSMGINLIIFHKKESLLWILIYFILNICYSVFEMKNVPLVDIMILTVGFVIRVIYGGEISNIKVSNWLYLVVLTASFYLALGKRRNELQMHGKKGRVVLEKYSVEFLDKSMYMCATLAIVFYSLWCMSVFESSVGIWTVPLVIVMVMRYNMNLEGGTDGDPIEILTKDRMLLLLLIIYFAFMICLIYIN